MMELLHVAGLGPGLAEGEVLPLPFPDAPVSQRQLKCILVNI